MMMPPTTERIEAACEVMHDAYEAAAVAAGWETQQRSRKPWAEVPEANKATMRAAVTALLNHLAVADDQVTGVELVKGPPDEATDQAHGYHGPADLHGTFDCVLPDALTQGAGRVVLGVVVA
jgi:hypothetical protein